MREDIKTFYYRLNISTREHCTTLIMDHFNLPWSAAIKEILEIKHDNEGLREDE